MALQALAEREPELAAQQLAAALAAAAPDAPGEQGLLGTAVALTSRLRRSGKLKAARQLAAAGARRSSRLRLEQALAAFALGEDGEVARLADADPEVKAVVDPLLDATRGAPPAPAQRGAPRLRRALHTVAGAVSAAVRGAPDEAQATLRRVAPAQRKAVLAAELGAAVAVHAGATSKALSTSAARLATSPALRATGTAPEVTVLALAEVDAELALDTGRRLGLEGGALRRARARAAAQALAAASGPRDLAALDVARRFGADAFDEGARATACIYEGFACLLTDPRRAARAFDQAIELGGDLIEALRGRMRLEISTADAVCPDCGMRHGGESGREAAVAADRLSRALARSPLGAPLAAAAALIAASGWTAAGDLRAARASLDRARAHATGALAQDVERTEAHLLAETHPERARELVERALAERPEDVAMWRLKVSLARRRGDREAAEAALMQAAEATKDPEIASEARDLRCRRGELAPFADLAPGTTAAGALAAEVHRTALTSGTPVGELAKLAQAHRDALDPTAQLAFDVACIGLAAAIEGTTAGRKLLIEAMRSAWSTPSSLVKLAESSWFFGLEAALIEAAASAGQGRDAAPALTAISEAALAAHDASIAERLIALGAAHWPHGEVARMESMLGEVKRNARAVKRGALRAERAIASGTVRQLEAPSLDATWDELDARLAPEFSLLDVDDGDMDGDPAELPDGDEGALATLLAVLGIPVKEVERLPESVRRELDAKAAEILRKGPSPAAYLEALELIERLIPRSARRGLPGRGAGGSQRRRAERSRGTP